MEKVNSYVHQYTGTENCIWMYRKNQSIVTYIEDLFDDKTQRRNRKSS